MCLFQFWFPWCVCPEVGFLGHKVVLCRYLIRTKFIFVYFNWRLITLQYCGEFYHTFTWLSHECTCFPHPEPHSHLPPHSIPQGHPSAPALSTLSHALNLDWWSISHMIIYMSQCYSFKSSHPCLLPQNAKVCYLHLCLFSCLAYRVVIAIFLNSIYMCEVPLHTSQNGCDPKICKQ